MAKVGDDSSGAPVATPKFCPRCGTARPPGGDVCLTCGLALDAPISEATMPSGPPAALRAQMMSIVGTMVGEYQVTSLIGEGGMGAVFAGIHPKIGKKVAIKVLKPTLSDDPDTMERFLAEARAVNKIGHPNIVDVFSFGSFPNGSQYYVMEFLAGRSLGTQLAEGGQITYRDAVGIIPQVLDALEAAHQRGIVHRDLKPDNIFLMDRPGGGYTVKLLDFGVAKFTDGGMISAHTRTGVPVGTPLYMSPEQCRGRGVGPQSDIYSIGVILHQMFAGAPPFVAESIYEVISAHLTKVPPSLSTITEAPVELEAVVTKCLAKNAADRFQTVGELREALMPVLQYLSGSATPAPRQLGPTPYCGTLPSVGESRPPLPTRSRTPLLLGVAIGAVVVAGAAVAIVFGTRRTPAPPPVAAPAPAASQPAPAAGSPRLVTIQFMVSPPDAQAILFVDGKQRDKLEFETPLSKTKSFQVRITAPGYQPFEANPRPLTDLVIPVNLVKLGKPAAPGPRRPPAAGTPSPAAPSKPATPATPTSPRVKRVEDI